MDPGILIGIFDLVAAHSASTISSATTATTAENDATTTSIYKVVGSDTDAGSVLTYSISGGADANLFKIDSASGDVTFKGSPNLEAPTDAGANNGYDIVVRASDGSLFVACGGLGPSGCGLTMFGGEGVRLEMKHGSHDEAQSFSTATEKAMAAFCRSLDGSVASWRQL